MKITRRERKKGRLTRSNLAEAIRQVRESGFVVLERVMPDEWVSMMRTAFDEETELFKPHKDGDNKRGGCQAPQRMPFLDPLAVENPWGLQIIEPMMGEDIWTIMPYHTNTSWPGADTQHIHRDTQHLFPGYPVALPPTLMVIHIPLIDFTEENGSTEVWPGTHLITDMAPEDTRPEQLAERAALMPSVCTHMPAGSVLVRDMRVWHRGMPNRTNDIRTMLSIVYFRQLHRLPNHLNHLSPITQAAKDMLSERAQRLYRYNPVEE
ncbi:MAG: phytanoyl-CoA dioxygenase family protein, partial [Candidatus Latescibacteria bacterium]|nr:phytanoyl-CoA dioxygenase family protein [Candidatus Latescibacterota bacterium]